MAKSMESVEAKGMIAFADRKKGYAEVRVYNYADWRGDGMAPPISAFEAGNRELKKTMLREIERITA